MKEIFKPVPYKPYNERYSVSSFGRVRVDYISTNSNNKVKFLRPNLYPKGYHRYALYYKGYPKKQFYVNHAILLAFEGSPPIGKNDAMHLDGDKDNNSLANLKWGSRKENIQHNVRTGRHAMGMAHGLAKLNDTQVITIRKLYDEGSYNQSELARTFGVPSTAIHYIVRRKTWKHI